MKIKTFREVRVILYLVFIANGLFVQYLSPMNYLCDYEGYSCSLCGMRTAIDFMFKLQFKEAYESNHFILVIVIIGIVMILDMLYILYKSVVVRRVFVRVGSE